MDDFSVCTISLKKFSVMNLFYPVIISIVGVLVIGVPLGFVAGIIDTIFFKTGTLVNIAIRLFLILWIALALFCAYSFVKVIDDLSKTVDALCVGDGAELKNIWLVILINILTLGIYKFVYFYRLHQRLEQKAPLYNDSLITSPGNLLIFTILASAVGFGPLVACALMIDDVNNFVQISNDSNGFETQMYQNWGIAKVGKTFDAIVENFKTGR